MNVRARAVLLASVLLLPVLSPSPAFPRVALSPPVLAPSPDSPLRRFIPRGVTPLFTAAPQESELPVGVPASAGSAAATAEGAAVVEDPWADGQLAGAQVLREGTVEVVYWPGDEAMAERTLRAAERPLLLPGIPRAAGPPEARVLLAPDPVAFESLTRGAPHWSAGVAVPSRQVIVLPSYQSDRTPLGDPLVALRHELVHLALNAYLPGRVPRWFDEGYATWA